MENLPMRRRTFIGASAAFALMPASKSQATENTNARAQFDELAQKARADLKAPGIAYGVVRDGTTIIRSAIGVRDKRKPDPMTTKSLFHMASLSKPFVATILAQRVQQGRLRLDQLLTNILPEFRIADPRARAITIEHLLTHSSGLPDVEDFNWDQPEYDNLALKRYIAGLSDLKLLFAPGESFSYSDIGYNTLARVIEVTDRIPFEEVADRTIFQPLRMRRTTFLFPEKFRSQTATPHSVDDKGNVTASDVFPYNRPHAGSSNLLSCIDDMMHWIEFNANGGVYRNRRILTPQMTANLLSPRPISLAQSRFPKGTKVALSWFMLVHNGLTLYVHPGSDLGFNAVSLFCPERRFGLVAAVNSLTDAGARTLLNICTTAIDRGLFDTTIGAPRS